SQSLNRRRRARSRHACRGTGEAGGASRSDATIRTSPSRNSRWGESPRGSPRVAGGGGNRRPAGLCGTHRRASNSGVTYGRGSSVSTMNQATAIYLHLAPSAWYLLPMALVIARYHEITLKRGNRARFAAQLMANIRRATADLPL